MKKFLSVFLCAVLVCGLTGLAGCGYEYRDFETRAQFTRELAGTQLNVYNWGEYISDGSDDSIDVNKEFERLTGIQVNYTTFESNETMYSQLRTAGVSYDIIIPSDYMIERMKNEGMLTRIDTSKISNFDLINPKYKNLYYDPQNEYSITFNVGMVGLIYNKNMVTEPPDSWTALWDENYRDELLMFSNPRDAFMIAQEIQGTDLNSENLADWEQAAELLKQQKKVLKSYVMDEVYGMMETGEAAMAPYYAGDFLTMYDINEDLGFVYPKEGTNVFVDAVCIPSCCKNYEAALMYINFLLEPEVALANAEYIGYASPNLSVMNNPEYCYYQNEILYPDEADLPKATYYHDISDEIRYAYENLWIDIKLY